MITSQKLERDKILHEDLKLWLVQQPPLKDRIAIVNIAISQPTRFEWLSGRQEFRDETWLGLCHEVEEQMTRQGHKFFRVALWERSYGRSSKLFGDANYVTRSYISANYPERIQAMQQAEADALMLNIPMYVEI